MILLNDYEVIHNAHYFDKFLLFKVVTSFIYEL